MTGFKQLCSILLLVSCTASASSSASGWIPRADPLPKPVSIAWTPDAPPLYFMQKENLLVDYPTQSKVLKKGIKRSIDKIFAEKWIPQALQGPPKKYEPFPVAGNQTHVSLSARDYQEQQTLHTTTPGPAAPSVIHKLIVKVNDTKAALQHGVNESYTLQVQDSAISIDSATVWGALHALVTLEQLVEWDTSAQRLFIERPVSIQDGPLYPYRGIMIDTARNFYTVKSLLRQLDAMALSKLNVFHWHMVDTQSWPVEIATYPDMTKDAFSPKAIYTKNDIRRIVQYAYARGIRVIPEIDMPAHSNSGWRQVNAEIISCGDSFWGGYNDDSTFKTAGQPTPGHLDILHPDTLSIVKNVYEDVSSMFKDQFFHVGLDEIVPNCYNYSSHITQWFKENSTRTYSDLVQHWIDSTLPMYFERHPDRRIVMWEDSVLSETAPAHHLSNKVILQSWLGGKENVLELLQRGYDVIVSNSDFFYLDCGAGGFVTNDPQYNVQTNPSPGKPSYNYRGAGGSWCAPYKTWQRIYSYDFNYTIPSNHSSPGLNYDPSQVLGASVQLWSEQSDSLTVDMKLWPRSAAFAELIWSGNRDANNQKRTSKLTARILNFRERLVQRGMSPEALVPRDCLARPHNCDIYMNQSIIADEY